MADFIGNALRVFAYSAPPEGLGGHLVGGHPEFDGWPRWDSITHQAVYEDWLHRAVEGGLRLMVMHAVNSEYLCGQVNRTLSCNDMEAVDRQLAAAKQMQSHVDRKSGGSGRGWYRIVYSPDEARRVMAQGKLAVVLGIEVDYLFNCRPERPLSEDVLRKELDRYYELGVRHLFPIHFGDNGFGGTAFQNGLQRGTIAENPAHVWNTPVPSPLNPVPTLDGYVVRTEDARAFGYQYRTGRRNVQGLTSLGKTLIREMIARGMIIDVDHMSARAKADVLDICEVHDYPVVSGHTGFVEISRGDKRHEGQLLPEEADRIRRLGGMIAIIPHQGNLDEIDTWKGPHQPVIPHTCGNTSNTTVQAYLHATSKMGRGPVGLGTDFNGFAGLPGPRYGNEACSGGGSTPVPAATISRAAAAAARGRRRRPSHPTQDLRLRYPFTAAASGQSMNRSVVGKKTFDFNVDGLAHVGMLPDLIADFQAMGLAEHDLEPLLNSADGYLQLWDKAHRARPRKLAVFEARPPQPWGLFDISGAVGGRRICGDPVVSRDGANTEVFARDEDGHLVVFVARPPAPWGLFDITNVASGHRISGDPVVSRDGANTEVFARDDEGRLVVFVARPPVPWGAFDISGAAGGHRIIGDPVVRRDGANTEVFARDEDGHLVVFVARPPAPWGLFDISNAAGGHRISGNPFVSRDGANTEVFARDEDGHLVVFVARPPKPWGLFDISNVAGGHRVSGDPCVSRDGANTEVFARDEDGRLVVFVARPPAPWGLFDISHVASGHRISGDPVVSRDGANTEVFARDEEGRLVVFVARPPQPWGAFDITAAAGGRRGRPGPRHRIGGDPVVSRDGANTEVFATLDR